MKPISANLKAHLAQEVTTLARLWKVTLTNGTVKAFTDHDRDIVYSGTTYLAASGYTASDVQSSSAFNVDNLEVQSFLDSSTITESDLMAGLWDYATVELMQVNWADLAQGHMWLRKGHLGEVRVERGRFVAELRGLMQALSRRIGEMYSPSCRANFGDTRCKVSLAAWTVTGTLTGVSSDNRVLFDSARTEAGPASPKAISSITKANPGVVTATAHGFVNGQVVYIYGVSGMTQVNGRLFTVANATSNTFTIEDTSAYDSSGTGGSVASPANPGHFDYGLITFTSGLNNGLKMEVQAYAPGTITLRLPMPYQALAGDTYSLVAGCGKRFIEDCKTRFNNVVNFRGEPHLPGLDKVLMPGGRS